MYSEHKFVVQPHSFAYNFRCFFNLMTIWHKKSIFAAHS